MRRLKASNPPTALKKMNRSTGVATIENILSGVQLTANGNDMRGRRNKLLYQYLVKQFKNDLSGHDRNATYSGHDRFVILPDFWQWRNLLRICFHHRSLITMDNCLTIKGIGPWSQRRIADYDETHGNVEVEV